ncbi:MAG: polyether ionophore transport system permease protein [Microbacteriaceae bacterium]|jgi:ABC-2 type transport system permease protein|nr:polyether ionophore transport system permease protein [Microbacteriaceae bacterium]
MSGLGVLLRHHVRRDRLQLIIWILGIGLLALLSTSSIQDSFGDSASRSAVLRLAVANPSILLLRGTPNGAGLNAFLFFEIFTFLALLAGLMNTFLAVRHTRAEEEFGRAELVGSTPAARTTPTVATVVYGIFVNLALGLGVALFFTVGTKDAAGSFVVGLATAGAGIAFLGVGLLSAQFMRTSRGANGLAAAAVTAAYLFRGIGDALGTPSTDRLHVTPAWWSWLSPIGWGQRTQAFDANTLLPLLLDLALAAASIAVVFVLQARRDSGASLIPGRAGRATARRTLSGSLGLTWRLQWPTIIGWCVGGALFGLLAGVLSKAVSEMVGVNATLQRTVASLVPGGHGSLAQIFISAIFVFVGVIAAACAIQVVMRMRQEEVAGTAELILVTRVSRLRWLVDYFVVGTVAIVLVLVSGAVASGLSSVATGESAARIGDSFEAAAAQLPAALVYLTALALVFVILPAWTIGLGWTLLAIGTFFGVFGGLIGLPEWARNISPFTHSPVPLGTSTDWSGGVWMLGIAVVAGILASVAVRRRELGTA